MKIIICPPCSGSTGARNVKLRRREGLSSYLADERWSEVSVGCHTFAALRSIINAYQKLWPDCITRHSSF
jgi:hypothetical protein